MDAPQMPFSDNQDYPRPDEFSSPDELETFLLQSSNPYLSVVYATEFAELYFKLRKEHKLVFQLESWLASMQAQHGQEG